MMNTRMITRQLNLNSQDAIKNNGTMNSNLYFNFRNIIQQSNVDEISHIDFSVENCQIPVSFYNITNSNNILDWNGNILTITAGNYNTTTLATEIINKLAAISITDVTIVLNSTTGKFVFTSASSNFTLGYLNSTIFKVIGFITNMNQVSTGFVLTSEYPVNLLGPLKLKISSGSININNIDSGNNGSTLNTLIEIPVSSANFGLILYSNVSNIHSTLNQKTLNGIDILVKDNDNNLVDFNNIDFTLSFLLKIYYKIKSIDEPIINKPVKKPIEDMTQDEILLDA
jgi:hypothetical protein